MWQLQAPKAAPSAALQEQRGTQGSREPALPQGLGPCFTQERVPWSHRQGHLHYPGFDCTQSTHAQSAETLLPFFPWCKECNRNVHQGHGQHLRELWREQDGPHCSRGPPPSAILLPLAWVGGSVWLQATGKAHLENS